MTFRTVVLLALSLTGITNVAEAADGPSADELVSRGLRLRKSGDQAGALRAFQAAHDKAPSPRTLAQMGLAEATLERWTDAETHLADALASTTTWIERNRPTLEETLQLARTHVAEVVVFGPNGASVTIANRTLGPLPLLGPPLHVNEGAITITVQAPRHKHFIETVTAKGGTRVTVTATLEPLPLPQPPPPPLANTPVPLSPELQGPSDLSSPPTWRRWTGFGLLTVGVAALAWGAVWVAIDGKETCAGCDVYNTRTPGFILLGAGGAAAIGGGLCLYTSRHQEVQLAALPTGLFGRF
jgi:hypothetical protein